MSDTVWATFIPALLTCHFSYQSHGTSTTQVKISAFPTTKPLLNVSTSVPTNSACRTGCTQTWVSLHKENKMHLLKDIFEVTKRVPDIHTSLCGTQAHLLTTQPSLEGTQVHSWSFSPGQSNQSSPWSKQFSFCESQEEPSYIPGDPTQLHIEAKHLPGPYRACHVDVTSL